MKEYLGLVIFLLSLVRGYGQENWKKTGIKLPPTICYASSESHRSFIEPPAEYTAHLKSASLEKATILVTYKGFSKSAQQAFQKAVDIWSELIYSPVPIHVQANWVSLDENVLGSCGPADFYKNFNSTQIWDCYYPVALVEKMLGEEVNSSESFEIIGSFNKDFTNWYFGTDGNTPDDKYDFVSTVLHELTHGLGFSGFFYTNSGKGGYGADGLSASFDQYVINKTGQQLIDTKLFTNPSISLYQNLTSGWLEFNTSLVDGRLPRLYAPVTYDDGSSIYHLDESTYSEGSANSLMTPFTGMGEAIYDPGPNTLAIMYDMGWKTISIFHTPLKDIEFVTGSENFEAKIESDFDLDSTSLYLVYSTDNFVHADSVLLTPSATSTFFNAQANLTQIGTYQYYFSATDVKNRKFVLPSNAPSRYFSFKIGVDNEPPVLTHDPVKFLLTTNLSAPISVEATDNIGIQSVVLDYFVNGEPMKQITLQNDTNDIYTGILSFPEGSVADGDVVSYRILATDNSSNKNEGRLPDSGFFTFNVQGFQEPVERYVTNFDTPNTDFIGSDFTIETVSGFDSPALNSAHPYLSPNTDILEFNFTSVLKYPIVLKTGGKITYDEIVLVEPGDVGNNFGDPNFWDYVIIEGSKDGGTTWLPFEDGYDSNAQTAWVDLFNSSFSGNNSTAVPTKNLFVRHVTDLLANGNFSAGDTVQVRFRLFSDPYANGWGWIIDNLAIQDYKTASSPELLSSGEIEFFPNPATNQLNVTIQAKNDIKNMILKAYNSSGKLVYTQQYSVGSNRFQANIDVSNFIPGLYLFGLEPEKGKPVTRKILIR
ncbi:MAG: T9SS type A sorting domain-containing protein [Prolixibacteraceae bacterium]|jgi:hypothetical protein